MSLAMILLLVAIVILVVIVLFYLIRPQSYIDKFNIMVDKFMNRTNEVSDEAIARLNLGSVKEVEIGSIETHYRFKIENAGHNRVVIIVVDEESNAYLNNNRVENLLEDRDGVRSLVGFSKANSGVETVKVIRFKDNTSSDPKVILGMGKASPTRATSPRVTQISDDDLLDGI